MVLYVIPFAASFLHTKRKVNFLFHKNPEQAKACDPGEVLVSRYMA